MKIKKNWMLACCIIPIVLLVALSFFGFSDSYLRWGVLLLCPLMMLFMMFGKDHCGTSECEEKKESMEKK